MPPTRCRGRPCRGAIQGTAGPSGAGNPAAGPVLNLVDYAELAWRGGFPDALALPDEALQAWLESYIAQVVRRDMAAGGTTWDTGRLAALVEMLALTTAGVVDGATINASVGIHHQTRQSYEALLRRLHVEDVVPAWAPNRVTGLTKLPKRYLVDSSLMAPAIHATLDTILTEPALLGRLIDTYTAAQIRPELTVAADPPRLRHLRDQGGRHEVDLILEYSLGRVVGIEVKAASAVSRTDARHLEWLRDRIGPAFLAGVVLHTGPEPYPLSERITAAPLSTLWA